jgi:phosphoserine aminotransferase
MTHRVWNFSAGPAAVPLPVLERVQAELLDWRGSGMSVMEMSHRGNDFMAIQAKAMADFRALLAIPDHYKIAFLPGGGIGEAAIVPLNLLGDKRAPVEFYSVHWTKRARPEGERNSADYVYARAGVREFCL